MCCSSCSSAASPAHAFAASLKAAQNFTKAKPILSVEPAADAGANKAPGTGLQVDKIA